MTTSTSYQVMQSMRGRGIKSFNPPPAVSTPPSMCPPLNLCHLCLCLICNCQTQSHSCPNLLHTLSLNHSKNWYLNCCWRTILCRSSVEANASRRNPLAHIREWPKIYPAWCECHKIPEDEDDWEAELPRTSHSSVHCGSARTYTRYSIIDIACCSHMTKSSLPAPCRTCFGFLAHSQLFGRSQPTPHGDKNVLLPSAKLSNQTQRHTGLVFSLWPLGRQCTIYYSWFQSHERSCQRACHYPNCCPSRLPRWLTPTKPFIRIGVHGLCALFGPSGVAKQMHHSKT